MTIRSAEVLVTSPGRNFVPLRITTEDGVMALGDGFEHIQAYLTAARLVDGAVHDW